MNKEQKLLDTNMMRAYYVQAQLFSHKYKTKKPSPIMRYVVIAVLLLMVLSSRGQQKTTLLTIDSSSFISKEKIVLIDNGTMRGYIGGKKPTLRTSATNEPNIAVIKYNEPKTLRIEYPEILRRKNQIDTVIIGNRIYTLKKD